MAQTILGVALLQGTPPPVLFLDIDGTISDIAPTPSAAFVPKEAVAALGQLHERLQGGLIILTGRTSADADRMLAPLRLPLAAVHGAEMRAPGSGGLVARAAAVQDALRATIMRISAPLKGVLVEDKTIAITVHYRLAPQHREVLLGRLRDALAEYPMLGLTAGRMSFEIHNAVRTKAEAVRAMMSGAPFVGRRPIIVGDDAADADAFVVAEEFGGTGLSVAGEFFAAGDAVFESPAHVRQWLIEEAGPCSITR